MLISHLKLVLVAAHASGNGPVKRLRASCRSSSRLKAGPTDHESGMIGPLRELLFRLLRSRGKWGDAAGVSGSSG